MKTFVVVPLLLYPKPLMPLRDIIMTRMSHAGDTTCGICISEFFSCKDYYMIHTLCMYKEKKKKKTMAFLISIVCLRYVTYAHLPFQLTWSQLALYTFCMMMCMYTLGPLTDEEMTNV